jgi:hypothetical protein
VAKAKDCAAQRLVAINARNRRSAWRIRLRSSFSPFALVTHGVRPAGLWSSCSTEPFADICSRACRIVRASERSTRALSLSFIRDSQSCCRDFGRTAGSLAPDRIAIHRFSARRSLRTECNTASTVRLLVAFRQFLCRTTGTSRKPRLECDQAPNRLPEATAALACFFGARTPSQTRWQLDPPYQVLAPLAVRIAGDARYSGAVHAGGFPTTS